jgi:hypothetical protein
MILVDPITLIKLHEINTALANELRNIREAMPGRGIRPVDSPIVEFKLKKIEQSLRMIGADPKNPVPFEKV